MNPCAYRQYVGGGLTQTFDTTHMYVYYSCNDIGKQGMRFNWMEESAQYGHSPVADCSDDTTKGSYVYNNVYRYDSVDQVEQTQVQKLIDSGLWKLVDGKLAWKKAPVKIEITDEGMNFHPDWLKNN